MESNFVETEIFDENDIPAVFEEEIISEDIFESYTSSKDSIDIVAVSPYSNPRSLLIPKSEVKFKQTLTVNRSLLRPLPKPKPAQPQPIDVDVQSSSKFRQTVSVTKPSNFVFNEHTMKIFRNKIKATQKRKAQAAAKEMKKKPKQIKATKVATQNSTNAKKIQAKKKAQLKNFIYIGPQKPKIVDPQNSGEIVRVEKAESDVEVDILSNSEDEVYDTATPLNTSKKEDTSEDFFEELDEAKLDDELENTLEELKTSDLATYELLVSAEIPTSELTLENSEITNLERFFHFEFFQNNSQTKTPERYLRIRNHIIMMWIQNKPSHLSKTSARNNLKNCGDVNCIGRIHCFLEQMGAINYGATNVHVQWIRPLKKLFQVFQQNIKNKKLMKKEIRNVRHSVLQPRRDKHQDANYTIQHELTSDSMINRIKSRSHHRTLTNSQRTQFELVNCQRFNSSDNTAPFEVSVTLSCLLCLYFHSLSSTLEIMGFIGGYISEKSIDRQKLNMTRYKPCRTSNQTVINCEMCPVSQVEQSTKLTDEGFELLGWFHSHPTNYATPSRIDLNTQNQLQLQFAPNNKHFIGFILSCVDMEFKCIYMQNNAAFELEVEVINDYSNFKNDVLDVLEIIDKNDSYETVKLKFFEKSNNLLKQFSIAENIEEIVKNIQI